MSTTNVQARMSTANVQARMSTTNVQARMPLANVFQTIRLLTNNCKSNIVFV